MNRKGFIETAILMGIAALITVGLLAYTNYKVEQKNLGATVFTTQLSDTMNTFREQVNSSTANLNAQLTSTISSSSNPSALQLTYWQTAGTSLAGTSSIALVTSTTQTRLDLLLIASSTELRTPSSTVGTLKVTTLTDLSGNNYTTSTFGSATTFNGTATFNANIVGAQYIPRLTSAAVTSSLDFATTTTTFIDLGTSTANGIASTTMTLSTSSRRVLINFSGTYSSDTASIGQVDFTVDGTSVSGGVGLIRGRCTAASCLVPLTATFLTPVLTTGAHTFRTQVKGSAGIW